MGNPLVPGTLVYYSQRRIPRTGGPSPQPMLLDRDGKAIRNPKPEDVVTVKFTIPDEKPFNTLPFSNQSREPEEEGHDETHLAGRRSDAGSDG